MGKRELVALLKLSSWCLVIVERLFLVVPLGCLRFVIVVFPDHTHLLFLSKLINMKILHVKLGTERQSHIIKQLMFSFSVNIRISQLSKVLFTSASPRWTSLFSG